MARYIISEYQRHLFDELITEEVKPSTPQVKTALMAAGYDANMIKDPDGYEYAFELLTPKARMVFASTEARGRDVITARDMAMDKLRDKVMGGNLKVNVVRKAPPVVITGFAGKKHPTVGLPAGGENLKAKIRGLKLSNRNDAFDVSRYADVKIDSHVYPDGEATYVIKPLSVQGRKFLPKVRTVKQDEMLRIRGTFEKHGINVITEEVTHE